MGSMTNLVEERLKSQKEYCEKTGISFDKEYNLNIIRGSMLSGCCEFNGKEIVRAFAEALTDANYHKEREQIIPEINRIFETKINPIG